MAGRVRLVDGQPMVREGGRWRPLSAGEQAAFETSTLQAFGLGVARGVAELATAPATLATAGLGWDLQGAPQAPQALTAPAKQVEQFHPNAVTAGEWAPVLATTPASSFVATARLPLTMAQRVSQRLSGQAVGTVERTLGERTGWAPVQALERGVQSMGGLSFLQRRREALLTRKALDSIGAEGNALTAEVRGANARRIGLGMDEILDREFSLSPATREALTSLQNPGSKLRGLLKRLDETPGPVDGQYIKNLRRQLSERQAAARGTDDLLADDLETAMEGLLDDIQGQLPDKALAAWRKLRIQYKNQSMLEKIPEVRHSGTLTARQAGNAFSRDYGNAYVRAQGIGDEATDSFMGLTRELAALKPYPESGTAARIAPVIGAISGGVTGDTGPEAIGQAAVGATAPALVSSAIGRALLAAGRLQR